MPVIFLERNSQVVLLALLFSGFAISKEQNLLTAASRILIWGMWSLPEPR